MSGPKSSGNTGGEGQQSLTAGAVAELIGGDLRGDGATTLTGIAPLDRALSHELSFLAHERYASWFAETRAGAVIVSPRLAGRSTTAKTLIVVDKPTDAMVQLLGRFHEPELHPEGVHSSAVIAPTASIGRNVSIEAHAVVNEHVVIGDGAWIGSGAVIGAHSTLGRDVRVHPSAVVYPRTEIGDRVILHSGARVGREGFGFVPRPDGITRIPHVGRCVLEHDVEIGCNSCVDRGSVDDTRIGAGTKIDNLVHVAHNVRIGRMCFVAALTGIAGSARVEDGVQLGGQVGVAGHLTIGARATIAAQAGVFGDVPAGETWSGYPARPHKEQLRAYAALYRLAKIIKPLERLLPQPESK